MHKDTYLKSASISSLSITLPSQCKPYQVIHMLSPSSELTDWTYLPAKELHEIRDIHLVVEILSDPNYLSVSLVTMKLYLV